MTGRFRYKAFISYSHEDEKWARWLHRALEAYRPPKALAITERLRPVFRDRDELAASSDLSGSILAALDDSENLIVICSPSAARSHWVNEEVREFMRLGRGDRIFCVLVGGAPNDPIDVCFPEALRTDRGKEPLGVDVRPAADGRTGAKLKLAAALLDVPFDQLRQREQQGRVRRLAYISAASIAGMMLAVALAVFALVSREQAIEARNEANEQRAIAMREADVANQTTEFLVDLFNVSDPSEARGNSITAREVLDSGAQKLQDEPDMEPRIEARLLRTVGHVYQELGLYGPAFTALNSSLETLEASKDAETSELATTLDEIGYLYGETGDYDKARSYYQDGLELRRATLEAPHIDIVKSLGNIARTYWRQDQLEIAMRLTTEAREMLDATGDDASGLHNSLTNQLANLYAYQGKDSLAEPLFRELLDARYEEFGEVHLQTGFAHDNLAITLDALGKTAEAEEHYRKALDILRQVYGDEHPEVAQTMGNLASFLMNQGDYDEAESLLQRAIDIHRRTIGDDYFMVADELTTLAEVELARGSPAEALDTVDKALGIYDRSLSAEHEKTRSGGVLRAEILVALERYPEAESELLQLIGNTDRESEPDLYESVADGLVHLYSSWGKPDAASHYEL